MSTIQLVITVEDIASVIAVYDRIKVYRASTIGGVYAEITIAATRILLEAGVSEYTFLDTAGSASSWYKVSYYKAGSSPVVESDLSDPMLGGDESVASIMSVQELKDMYLFGVDLTKDDGTPFPDIMFEWGIRQAIARMERELDIRIKPTVFTDERYDYYFNDYTQWTFIRLRESPIISVEGVAVKWPSDSAVIQFPTEWIQLRKDMGQINIVPTSGTLSQVLLTAGGSFLPLIASGQGFVPNILSVDFTAGFAEGACPIEIRDIIGKFACFGPLNVAGDLIAGAGIASNSLGIDGLSQSVSTTSSATNAGYGSRLIRYDHEIKEQLPLLRRYYKGLRMVSL